MTLTATRATDDIDFIRKVPRSDNFLYGYLFGLLRRWCRPGQRVLDVGCGVGPLSLYLASRGCAVVGVEIAERSVIACRRAAEFLGMEICARFVHSDFNATSLDGPFDVVVCCEVLEHIPDDRAALAHIRGILAPDGLLLLSVPSPNEIVHRVRMKRFGRDAFDEAAGHLRRYTAPQLCALLEGSGFRVTQVERTEGPLRNSLPLTAPGRFILRAVRFSLTPLLLAADRLSARWIAEGGLIVVARRAESPPQ